jgi:homocitrate synthase NifV
MDSTLTIDLWDETMREGAERSPLQVTVEDKVKLAVEIQKTGLMTFVTGMFPDVPHNKEILLALIQAKRDGHLHPDTKFFIISHLGDRIDRTVEFLRQEPELHGHTWVLCIHAVSDQQIDHMFPTIRAGMGNNADGDDWISQPLMHKRGVSLEWLGHHLSKMAELDFIGGFAVGLIDAYRADPVHVREALDVAHGAGARTVRLIDTAGTCTPHQVTTFVGPIVTDYPDVAVHGHFHNDFGMAGANALEGLRVGMRGVDVSVGGLANRAGHPALAEVLLGARDLYGLDIAGYDPSGLYDLSRYVEGVYGIMERPTQPLTGTVTYSVLSGIRTDLLDRAPTIFDIVDPGELGNRELRLFGIRSGEEGLLRIMRKHERELTALGVDVNEDSARDLFARLTTEWSQRSELSRLRLARSMAEHHEALEEAFFTEDAVHAWITQTAREVSETAGSRS